MAEEALKKPEEVVEAPKIRAIPVRQPVTPQVRPQVERGTKSAQANAQTLFRDWMGGYLANAECMATAKKEGYQLLDLHNRAVG